ncbi:MULTISPECIES: hypothetical protein [Aerosakkonema]|uniref:hypothetical protein n=1 Tax=Aerosakkonema TaxID=1246629 RepID=UPI0035B7A14B
MEKDYLIALIRGCGLTICHGQMINPKKWHKAAIMAKIMRGSLRRYLQHLLKYGGEVITDAIAAGEMEFYLSSLASPVYFIKTSLVSQLAGYAGKKNILKMLEMYK